MKIRKFILIIFIYKNKNKNKNYLLVIKNSGSDNLKKRPNFIKKLFRQKKKEKKKKKKKKGRKDSID